MFSKFENLKSEKQTTILNAALKEFSQKGFKNASTDEIVKGANISKGALFHYFKNKKCLFLYLYDYTLEILMNEFYRKIDMDEKDILKRMRQLLLVKFSLIDKYPDMFNFVKLANFEESSEVKEDLDKKNKGHITSSLGKLVEDIDVSKFKEGIDIKRAIDIIIWTLEGFSAKEQEVVKHLSLNELNYKDIVTEVDIYLELLRKSFYR